MTNTIPGAGVSGTTSGGYYNPSNDPDLPSSSLATLTVNLSGATSNSGFRFGNNNSQYKFQIINSGETATGSYSVLLTKG